MNQEYPLRPPAQPKKNGKIPIMEDARGLEVPHQITQGKTPSIQQVQGGRYHPQEPAFSISKDTYLHTPENAYTGYSKKTTLALITHIYYHYDRISATDMAENNENLRSCYNAEDPLEGLVERLNKCVELTEASGNLFTETQLIFIVYRLVAETRQYPEYCWLYRTQ